MTDVSQVTDNYSGFDLHTHTFSSKDGMMSRRTVLRQMIRVGLRGVAITEHERPSLLRPIVQDERFFLNACEYKTTDYGELIGLFVSEPISERTLVETAEAIHEQNGIVVLPHPRDPLRKYSAVRRGLPEHIIARHVDLIEGFNARCVLRSFNLEAQELATRLGKPMTAGSDAHLPAELGHGRTLLADVDTIEDVYEQLRRGRTRIWGRPSLFFWQVPTMIWQRARRLVR